MSETEHTPPSEPAASTPTKSHPWYSLTPWAFAVGGLVWVLGVLANGLRYIETKPLEEAVSLTMGSLVGGLIVPVILYGIALLIGLAAGKRRLVLSTAFVVLIVGVYGSILAIAMTRTDRVRTAQEDDPARKASIQVIGVMRQRVNVALSEYSASLTGIQDYPLRIPGWITTEKDLETARSAVQNFRTANESFKLALSYSEEQVRAEYAKHGVTDESLVRKTVDPVRGNSTYADIQRIRDLDAEFADQLEELCDFYLRTWGAWSFDTEHEMILFDEDDDLAEWQAIEDRMQVTSAEQQRLIEKINGPESNAEPEHGD